MHMWFISYIVLVTGYSFLLFIIFVLTIHFNVYFICDSSKHYFTMLFPSLDLNVLFKHPGAKRIY